MKKKAKAKEQREAIRRATEQCSRLHLDHHSCPPHEHGNWCQGCSIKWQEGSASGFALGQKWEKDHHKFQDQKIVYLDQPVPAFRDFPTFVYWLAMILAILVAFFAGAAWQYPHWIQ